MAVLSTADRQTVSAEFQRQQSVERSSLGLTKTDLQAAVNALDDFLNTNAAAINSAIPQPARAALTTTQKAKLLVYVVERRYIAGA